MESQSPSHAERGAAASEVAREIVKIHARLYGRGPTKAKAYVESDYVLCVLEDVFTQAEKTLIEAGNAEQVHEMRRSFRASAEPEFIAIVERTTGRKVRSFVGSVHVVSEVSVKLFLFEEADPPSDPSGSAL